VKRGTFSFTAKVGAALAQPAVLATLAPCSYVAELRDTTIVAYISVAAPSHAPRMQNRHLFLHPNPLIPPYLTQRQPLPQPQEWNGVSEDAKHIITLMLTPDPEERPTAAQLLQHPWVAAAADGPAHAATLGEHMVARLRVRSGCLAGRGWGGCGSGRLEFGGSKRTEGVPIEMGPCVVCCREARGI